MGNLYALLHMSMWNIWVSEHVYIMFSTSDLNSEVLSEYYNKQIIKVL